MREVKEILQNILDTDQKKLIYQMSDGSKGIIEITKTLNASPNTVDKCWKNWTMQNLGETVSVKGGKRFKRAFDLGEIGIEIPEAKREQIIEEKQEPSEGI